MPIIAEVGQNFCGDLNLAVKLIKLAKTNGARLVKFQLYDSRKLYGKKQDTELSFGQAETLVQAGKDINIPVFFSVFDLERLDWCKQWNLTHYKIAYSRRLDSELLDAIPDDAELFVSCKTANDCEITLNVPYKLFCIPCYPADPLTFTLPDFRIEFDGFSDHTIGLDVAKVAIARGCYWVEKHFALDHKTGVDAPWSMDPYELKELADYERIARSI